MIVVLLLRFTFEVFRGFDVGFLERALVLFVFGGVLVSIVGGRGFAFEVVELFEHLVFTDQSFFFLLFLLFQLLKLVFEYFFFEFIFPVLN